MPRIAKAKSAPKESSSATIGFEAKLWLTADKLRNNMDAAEYKHVVLGLIFLKYISDTFEEHRAKLLAGEGDYAWANAEAPDEYKAENVFWVPAEARWPHLQASAKQPTIGKIVDDAMVAINQGFIAMKCNDRASNFFMLNWCQINMAEIESRATGTTFVEISKQNFRPIRVVLPPKELMAAFTAKISSLYAQITANLRQSRTLATLRDTLLPKLLSGELSMADTTPYRS